MLKIWIELLMELESGEEMNHLYTLGETLTILKYRENNYLDLNFKN